MSLVDLVVPSRMAMSQIGEFQWNTSWTLLTGGPHTSQGLKNSGYQLSLRSSTEHFLWHATFAARSLRCLQSLDQDLTGPTRDKLCVDVEIVSLGWFEILQNLAKSWKLDASVAHCSKHRLKARRTPSRTRSRTPSFLDLSTCSANEGHKARRVHT